MRDKTIYRRLIWTEQDGEAYANGEFFTMDETGARSRPVAFGWSLRVMVIRMAIEEFPNCSTVKRWHAPYAMEGEDQRYREALGLLSRIPIPWVAGFYMPIRGPIHQPCFQQESNECFREGHDRPQWSSIIPTWQDEFRCCRCKAWRMPRIKGAYTGDEAVTIRCSVDEARELMGDAHPDLGARIMAAVAIAEQIAEEGAK